MTIKNFIFGLSGFLAVSPLAAQTKAEVTDTEQSWDKSVSFSISPRIGNSLPSSADDNVIDESEFGISGAISRKDIFGFNKIEFKAGVTSAPQLLNDSDAASALYGQVTLGDTYVSYRELILRASGQKTDKVADAWRPYARYRFTTNYSDFLGSHSRDDHQVTAGIRYRDIRTIMASSKLGLANEVGADSETIGWYWEARAEVSQTWSTDSSRTRSVPVARIDLYSRPIAGGLRFFGRLQGDATFYHDAKVANGDKRIDKRVRLTAGFDVSELFAKSDPSVSLEIAGQYQRRWSNEATAEHERLYFTPSFSITKLF